MWKAREEELQWVEKQQKYEVADIDEAWEVTGKAPITLKWVDRNKGDWERPNYRSRLVVREVKNKGQMVETRGLRTVLGYASAGSTQGSMQPHGVTEDQQAWRTFEVENPRH